MLINAFFFRMTSIERELTKLETMVPNLKNKQNEMVSRIVIANIMITIWILIYFDYQIRTHIFHNKMLYRSRSF